MCSTKGEVITCKPSLTPNPNLSKDKSYINFKTKQDKTNNQTFVPIDGKEIQVKDSVKFLGLVINTNLDWNERVKQVLEKISTRLFVYKTDEICI